MEGITSSKETDTEEIDYIPNLLLLTDYSLCSQVLMHVISATKKHINPLRVQHKFFANLIFIVLVSLSKKMCVNTSMEIC